MTASGARALARQTVRDDHHVTELGPRVEELSGEDDAAADARAECQRREVRRVATGAVHVLGVRRAAGVVLDADGQVEAGPERSDEVHLAQRDVDGAERVTGPVVETRRDAEADRADPVERELPNSRREPVEEGVLRARRRRMLDGLDDAPVVDQTREDLRSAEVDADHTVRVHLRWVT
jgi:hypothetical protein